MKTFVLTDNEIKVDPCVATIGFFDGVHRGHQYLIEQVRKVAVERGLVSTVITFDTHPRQVLNSEFKPQLLNSFDEKVFRLSLTNIDNCAVLPFNHMLAQLSAREFMEQILLNRLQVKILVIGYDNRFGHNRSEGFDDYVRYGKELGIEVILSKAFLLKGVKISSSVVRSFISEGEVELANQCLGYPYTIFGHVVDGEHTGRKLGFPTANIQPNEPYKHIPAGGVYAVKVRIEGTVEMKHSMLNIGVRPTFGGTSKQVIEAHVFRFEDDIYGHKIAVSFMHRIRAERKFKTPEDLTAQLQKDYATVEEQFLKDIEDES